MIAASEAVRGFGAVITEGLVLLADEKPQAAVDALSQALKLNSHLTDADRGLADAYQSLGQMDRAVERAPGKGTTQYHLGMTYARMGKKQDAVSTLKREAHPDFKLGEAEKISDGLKQIGG